jgi:hypothetical protein
VPLVTRFEVLPTTIYPGQSATLSWEYVNGTSAILYPQGQSVGPTGLLTVAPATTTSYRLVVSNASGSTERTVTLVVQAPPVSLTPTVSPTPPVSLTPTVSPTPPVSPTPTTPQTPPVSPADLRVSASRPDGFDLAWTDASMDEQGFRLYNADTGQVVVTYGAGVSGGSVSGLSCATSYRFYLVAFNAAGQSWPSNTVQATTSACP